MLRHRVQSLGWEDTQEKEMETTPVLLPGKSYEQRSLAGYSPWGLKSWIRQMVRHGILSDARRTFQ